MCEWANARESAIFISKKKEKKKFELFAFKTLYSEKDAIKIKGFF